MALAVSGKNRHYRWNGILSRHWVETAWRCGFSGMPEIVTEIADRTSQVLEHVRGRIPRNFPPSLAEAILNGIRAGAERLIS